MWYMYIGFIVGTLMGWLSYNKLGEDMFSSVFNMVVGSIVWPIYIVIVVQVIMEKK